MNRHTPGLSNRTRGVFIVVVAFLVPISMMTGLEVELFLFLEAHATHAQNLPLSHALHGTECGTESVVQSVILCKLRSFGASNDLFLLNRNVLLGNDLRHELSNSVWRLVWPSEPKVVSSSPTGCIWFRVSKTAQNPEKDRTWSTSLQVLFF